MLLDLYPTQTPASNSKEMLMPADKAIVAYREWLDKFQDMGWRIDLDEFHRRNGKDVAFAIPSPARHSSGNWVIEPIPLIKAKTAAKAAVG